MLPHHPPPPPPLAAGGPGALSTALAVGTDVGALTSAPFSTCASRISSLVLALPLEAGVYAFPVALVVLLEIRGVVGLELVAGFAINIFSSSPNEVSSSSAFEGAFAGAGLGLA